MATDNAVVERAFDVRVSSVRGSTVVVRGGEAFELREVESLIWSLCDGEHTAAQIVGAVQERYGVNHETATVDVREFIDELADAKLIIMRPG